MTVDAWIDALQERHRGPFRSSEFLRAVRALSARYVEKRAAIRDRSPLDSAGKKAAFAAFYAPLHFLTAREIVRRLGPRDAPLELVVDLGCGTGVMAAALAIEHPSTPRLHGIDAHPWALGEAAWNWRQLHLRGDAKRGDFAHAVERLLPRAKSSFARTAIVAGWSVNELADDARRALLPHLLDLGRRGAHVLIVEPLARSAVPWWDEWAAAFASAGGRADEWRFEAALPAPIREISESAGFQRETLTARSVCLA